MGKLTNFLIAAVIVWVALAIFLPFIFGFIVLPGAIIKLIQIAVVAWAIWFAFKG